MTPQEQLEFKVLEHIYDHDRGQLNEPANLGPLYERFGEGNALSACQGLRLRGLIESDNRLSGGYHITASGKTAVEEIHARRSDRSHRRAMCREQLLRWLDANSDAGSGVRPGAATFEGAVDLVPFTQAEVDAAIKYLKSRELVGTIEAWGGPAAMWITDAGREVVDAGGVAAAESAQQSSSVSNTFNMAGSGNVFATAAAPGATATANVTNFNLQYAKALVAAIRAAEAELNLTDEDRADLARVEAAEAEGDLTLAQRATARLYQRADQIAMGTLGGILLALAKQALGLG